MKTINLFVAIILGICSLPALFSWPGLTSFTGGLFELTSSILGWLAWASLACLCLNYKELGTRPLPWPLFIFGGIATIFFFSCLAIGLGFTSVKDPWQELVYFGFGVWPSLLFIHLTTIHMLAFKRIDRI